MVNRNVRGNVSVYPLCFPILFSYLPYLAYPNPYIPYFPYPICLSTLFQLYYPSIFHNCPILYVYPPIGPILSFYLSYLAHSIRVSTLFPLYYLSIHPTCPIISFYLPYIAYNFLFPIESAFSFSYPHLPTPRTFRFTIYHGVRRNGKI